MKVRAAERGVWLDIEAPGKVSEILEFDMKLLREVGDCAQVKVTGGPKGHYIAFVPEGVWDQYASFLAGLGLKIDL